MYNVDITPRVRAFSGELPGGRFKLRTTGYSAAKPEDPGFTDADTPPCWIFDYVLHGQGFLEVGRERHSPAEGDLIILPKRGTSYAFVQNAADPWGKLPVLADGELLEELLAVHGLMGRHHFGGCFELKDYFLEFYGLSDADGLAQHKALLLFHKIFLALKARAASPCLAIPERALALKRLLDESLERPVALGALPAKLGGSRESLIRSFKRHCGATPYAYLLRKRVEAAKVLLRYSSLSVKEIAEKFCFTDQYHFSKYFKKTTGFSPTAFKTAE